MDGSKSSPGIAAAWLAAALVALCLLLTSGSLMANGLQQYEARYAVYRNGKLAGKAEFTFGRNGEDGRWQIRSEAAGTHGLARLLRARDIEYAEGTILEGRFRPDEFMHHSSVAGIDDRWTADFDWEHGLVKIEEGRERRQFELSKGVVDGLSLKLEIQRRLRAGQEDLNFRMVDDDEIEQQNFRQLQPERLETSLGCLETVPVERVREGSTRYTRSWHAPELGYVTVRMEHGKKGGDHLEMRITELVLDGETITPQAGCMAYQSGR